MSSNTRELAAVIATLMSLYWTPDDDPEIRRAQFDMFWLPELREFDIEIVRAVCREWQQHNQRRPLPGDIRRLCIGMQADRALKITKCVIMTEEEITATADNWARSHGHALMSDMQRSKGFTGATLRIGPGQFRRFDPIPIFREAAE